MLDLKNPFAPVKMTIVQYLLALKKNEVKSAQYYPPTFGDVDFPFGYYLVYLNNPVKRLITDFGSKFFDW